MGAVLLPVPGDGFVVLAAPVSFFVNAAWKRVAAAPIRVRQENANERTGSSLSARAMLLFELFGGRFG